MDIIIWCAFICAGVIALIFSMIVYVKFRVLRNWVRTVGVVSKVITEQSDVIDGSSTLNSHTVYGLEYTYTVNGKKFNGSSSMKSTVNRKYRVGSEIIVVYNPNNCEKSDHFELFYNYLHLALFIPGAILLSVGLIGVIN
jgi:hypothetical protein